MHFESKGVGNWIDLFQGDVFSSKSSLPSNWNHSIRISYGQNTIKGSKEKKLGSISPTTFTLYTNSPPLRVTTKLNQCHFHGPSKENNQIGKVPTSCSVWDQVLDPSTLQQLRSCSFSSSFLPSFLSFLLYFLVFSPLVLLSPRIASPSSNSPPLSQCLISFPTHSTN